VDRSDGWPPHLLRGWTESRLQAGSPSTSQYALSAVSLLPVRSDICATDRSAEPTRCATLPPMPRRAPDTRRLSILERPCSKTRTTDGRSQSPLLALHVERFDGQTTSCAVERRLQRNKDVAGLVLQRVSLAY
jgi:hypothetical protein